MVVDLALCQVWGQITAHDGASHVAQQACVHRTCMHTMLPAGPCILLPCVLMAAEASMPESRRVYCPFPGCAVLLMNEEATLADQPSECPACHRAFCAG